MAEAPKLEFPAPSPAATLKQRVGLTDIEVVYSRPSLKDRKVFGDGAIVPYGKVWRTGANAATKVTFSTPVKLNGHEVPAGTFALFTIPTKDEWTVIINKGPKDNSPYNYDQKDDVVRFQLKPTTLAKATETFTIDINNINDRKSQLDIQWDKVELPIALEVQDYTESLKKQIDERMASNEPGKPYFQAAAFYFNNGFDIEKANEWVAEAVKEKDAHWINYLKAQILQKKGDKKAALEAAKHSNELSVKANDSAYIKQSADLITKLQ